MSSQIEPLDGQELTSLEADVEQWEPYATSITSSQKDPLLPVTSHILSPKALFWLRFCLSTYTLVFMVFYVWSQIYGGIPAERIFVYFTNLTFFAEVSYIWASTFHSFNFVYNPATKARPPPAFVAFPLLQRLHAWLYSTVAVYHIVVPLVYWSVLSRKMFNGEMGTLDIVESVGTHAMDFVMMATEVIVSRNVVRRSHWRVIAIVFCLYMLLAYTNYWVNGWFVYYFVDYTKELWYLWLVALLVLLALVFIVQVYLHRLRDRIGYRLAQARLLRSSSKLSLSMDQV